MHVSDLTKVYFIQLVHTIKYVEFEDKPNNFFIKKTCGNEKVSARRLIKNSLPKIGKYEHLMTFAKVANNRFDRTHCDD